MKALEPVAHEYMDYFVAKMKELGSEPTGVGLMKWTNWLATDQGGKHGMEREATPNARPQAITRVACLDCLAQLTRPRKKFGTSRCPRLQCVCHGHASL